MTASADNFIMSGCSASIAERAGIPCSGIVLSVYEKAVNMQLGGHILSVTDPDLLISGAGIVAKSGEEMFRLARSVQPQDEVLYDGKLIRVNASGRRCCISPSDCFTVLPDKTPGISTPCIRRLSFHVNAILQQAEPAGIAAATYISQPFDLRNASDVTGQEYEFSGQSFNLRDASGVTGQEYEFSGQSLVLRDLCNIYVACKENPQNLPRFLGAGIGLTPSGDDFLCGVSDILWAYGQTESAKWLAEHLLPRLSETTAFSAAILEKSLRGICGPSIRQWLLEEESAAETGASPQEKPCTDDTAHPADNAEYLLKKICGTGHSSGQDFLCGVLFGLELVLRKKRIGIMSRKSLATVKGCLQRKS